MVTVNVCGSTTVHGHGELIVVPVLFKFRWVAVRQAREAERREAKNSWEEEHGWFNV